MELRALSLFCKALSTGARCSGMENYMEKVKKTIMIAIFVSLAAQIRFQYVTHGFIIAMSVLVMAIFIYCYEDLSPTYIAICSGVFSPLFRIIILLIEGGEWQTDAILVIPDTLYFFAYALIYPLVYRYLIREQKTIKNFPYAIFLCDFCSNLAELGSRSLIIKTSVINMEVIVFILVIALFRTILIQMILLAMEAYSSLLVKEEHDAEYKRLIVQASIFESELHVMEKNAAEIEEIMKQAYTLYKAMEEINAPKELKNRSLDISKNAHEIKGDYLNIIHVLKDTFVNEIDEGKISFRDIVSIERANLLSLIKNQGRHVEFTTRIKTDFYVKEYFKMMSVIRNLLLNAVEALGETGGRIVLTAQKSEESYVISVRDNGSGIAESALEAIFYEGYSTKFNEATGNVQRGIGLPLVKDYVENYFHGEIRVQSEKGKFTEFTVTIPMTSFEEAQTEDEVLYR